MSPTPPQLSIEKRFHISAESPQALNESLRKYIHLLMDSEYSLENISQLALTIEDKKMGEFHFSFFPKSRDQLKRTLEAFLGEANGSSSNKSTRQPKIAFVCSGQGGQWPGMGNRLMEESPVFKKTVEEIDRIYYQMAGWSFLEELRKRENLTVVVNTEVVQPALFALQVGLIEAWKTLGLGPSGFVGHSLGEITAAYGAGILDLKQALTIVYHRSKGQNKFTSKGAMMVVGLTFSDAFMEVLDYDGQVSVAAYNSLGRSILSGDLGYLKTIADKLKSKDIYCDFLPLNVPFHTPMMDAIKDKFLTGLQDLNPKKPVLPFYSTVTGTSMRSKVLDAFHWFSNIRETVFFVDAIENMVLDGFTEFIEIGPHPLHLNDIENLMQKLGKEGIFVPSMEKTEEGIGKLLNGCLRLKKNW